MAELTILQVSIEELQRLIKEATDKAIADTMAAFSSHNSNHIETMLGVMDMCKMMGISRSQFETYKEELIEAGMFRLSDQGSFRIYRADFDRWISGKQEELKRKH